MRRALLALVKKDLKVFRADRRAVIIAFAMPALLALLFGFAFRGSRGVAEVRTRVVDADGSPGSRRIVALLESHSVLGAKTTTRAEAEDLLRRGKIDVAVVIPAGFVAAVGAAVRTGSPRPELELLVDATARMEASIAENALPQIVAEAVGAELGPDFVRCATAGAPFTTERRSVSGGDLSYDGAAHSLAGMGVQFVLMGAVEAAVVLLTERQRGLFRRLHAAPLRRTVLVGSRLVSGALIAIAVLAFLYVFGKFTLGVAIGGAPLGFALVVVTFALMASALGMLIATFGKTPQATRGVGIFVILLATMLSGAWVPSFLFPRWMQTATLFVPSRWAVDGLDAMTWRGLGLGDALAPAGVLLASALVFGGLAALRFRWDD